MAVTRPRPELLVPLDDAKNELNGRMDRGKELYVQLNDATYSNWEDLKRAYEKWDAFNIELLRGLFTTEEISNEYVGFDALVSRGYRSLDQELERLREKVANRIHRLDSISGRLALYVPRTAAAATPPASTDRKSGDDAKNNNVFIVHGHDVAAKETVARFLSVLGLNPVILHEQSSGGRTIIEKFEHYGSDVGFAVILLTPDDVGHAKASPKDAAARARQNVILELGYFVALLGRHRVCALVVDSIESPSDILGVVYISMDAAKAWQVALARELKAAGFAFDLNRIV